MALSLSKQGSHGGGNSGQLVILGPQSRKQRAKNLSVYLVFCFVYSLGPSSENGAPCRPTSVNLIPHRHAHRVVSQVTQQ